MEKTNEELQLRIRELEKEIAKLHTQIKKERYGLVWLDVPEGFERETENQIPVLEEVKDKAIKNDDGKPTHIIIEGDNYHALTCLNYTHKGKIDVIYIDPPYNTGEDNFAYRDKRVLKEYPDGTPVPKDHPLRHSYWLSFMSKRLELAKNLLSDKGVIFISIDDNEQANLKLLCDKIFGEENFVGCAVWLKKRKGSFLSNKLVSLTEYVFIYAKTSSIQLYGGKPDNTESQPIIKRTNTKKTLCFRANLVKTKLSNGIYRAGVYGESTTASELLNDIEIKDGVIVTDFKIHAPFVWGQDFLEEEISKGTEFFINTKNLQVRVIRHNNDSIKALPSFIDGRDCGATNEDAYELLKEIFSMERPFEYSKPINLIQNLILSNSYFNKSSIILDFFAGSGTTLHATMKLNAEDGGNRQCILVQQKEGDKNICESVTYERNKRVINGYENAKGETVEGLGNSLKYYRTAFVGKNPPRRATDYDKAELSKKAGCLLALAENTLEEIEASNSYQIFSDGKNHYTGVYFTGRLTEIETFTQKLEDIRNQNRRIKITAYFFCWGDCAQFEDEFSNLERISLQPIPKPILDIYQSINR